jgi:hypothetical protein
VPWNDSNGYVPTTGGSFESGQPAWALSGGASIVNDNASNKLDPSTDSHALHLAAGSSATSACVTAPGIIDIVRFFAKSTGGQLEVEILVKGGVYDAGTITAGSQWSPSPILTSNAPAYKGAVTYQIRLTAVGTTADFTLDDSYFDLHVAIDPSSSSSHREPHHPWGSHLLQTAYAGPLIPESKSGSADRRTTPTLRVYGTGGPAATHRAVGRSVADVLDGRHVDPPRGVVELPTEPNRPGRARTGSFTVRQVLPSKVIPRNPVGRRGICVSASVEPEQREPGRPTEGYGVSSHANLARRARRVIADINNGPGHAGGPMESQPIGTTRVRPSPSYRITATPAYRYENVATRPRTHTRWPASNRRRESSCGCCERATGSTAP